MIFSPIESKIPSSVYNSSASASQGIILAFCGKYLSLKPGVSVDFDQSYNSKSWAAPSRLIVDLSWHRIPI